MTKFKQFIFQSVSAPNISKMMWFDERYIASISAGTIESQSDIAALSIRLLPPQLWPKLQGESKFAYFFEGTQAMPGTKFPFAITGRSL